MSLVFPRSNLNPNSQQWARAVQGEIQDAERSVRIARQDREMDNRGSASASGLTGRNLSELEAQFEELACRRAEFVTHPGVLVPVTSISNQLVTFSGSVAVPLPPTRDGSVRKALVYVSLQAESSNHAAGSSNITPSVSGGGLEAPLTFGVLPAPAMGNLPPGWVGRAFQSGVSSSSGGNFTVSFSGNIYGNAPQTTLVGVTQVNIVVVYGEKA